MILRMLMGFREHSAFHDFLRPAWPFWVVFPIEPLIYFEISGIFSVRTVLQVVTYAGSRQSKGGRLGSFQALQSKGGEKGKKVITVAFPVKYFLFING